MSLILLIITLLKRVADQPLTSFLKTFLKVAGWITGIIVLLLVSIVLLIRLPGIQNQLTQRAIRFVEEKIGTTVQLQNIYISFPKKIVLKGLYLEDQSKDTLLYVEQLSIDADLWALVDKRIVFNDVDLSGGRICVNRSSDRPSYNFDYMINAFTDSTKNNTGGGSTWAFVLGEISLSHVLISYVDDFSGNNVQANLGSLNIEMNTFDLASSVYDIKSVKWSNSSLQFGQSKGNEAAIESGDTSGQLYAGVTFSKVELNKINISYTNISTNQKWEAAIGQLTVDANLIDLPHHTIDLNLIQIQDSFLSYFQRGADVAEPLSKPAQSVPFTMPAEWNARIGTLNLSGNAIRYEDLSKPVVPDGFDPSHLWLKDLEVEANGILVLKQGAEISITRLSFNEENGLAIHSLAGRLALTNASMTSHIELKSEDSGLEIRAKAKFETLDELFNDYERVQFDVNVLNSSIALKDVLFFAPTLLDSIPNVLPMRTAIAIKAHLHGTLDDLTLEHLNLSALSNTALSLQGSVKGLPNLDRLAMDIQLAKLYTTANDVKQLLPDSLLPGSIQLPEWVQLQGDFKGPLSQPQVHLLVTSNVGDLKLDYIALAESPHPTYQASFITHKLDIGKILDLPKARKLDAMVRMKGSGFTMDKWKAALEVSVTNFIYSDYAYANLKVNATIDHYLIAGRAEMHDENLTFLLTGSMDYQIAIPRYVFSFDLKNADFKAMHLSDKPLKVKALLNMDIATSDFKILNGTMGIRNVGIYNGKALYRIDSLLFASLDQEGKSELSVRSEILTGDFKGTFNVFDIRAALEQHLNRYFHLNTKLVVNKAPQKFAFDLTIKNTDLITQILFPELHSFVPGKIAGAFDSEQQLLNLDVEITKLRYANTLLDSFKVNITSDRKAITYSIKFHEFEFNAWKMAALRLEGEIADDKIQTRLLVLDSLEKRKYLLSGNIRSSPAGIRYSLEPDQLLLNYEHWSTPSDNYLLIGNKVVAHHFSLSKDAERFSITTNAADSVISFDFEHWSVATLAHLVEGTTPISGELNGNIKMSASSAVGFNSLLRINNLSIQEKQWGDLSLALIYRANRYAINLDIRGTQGSFNAKGSYAPGPASALDLDLRLSQLDVSLIEPFLGGQLKNVTGFVNGNLNVVGNIQTPAIRGKLTFQDVHFLSTYLNDSFTLAKESIEFREQGIVLKGFKVIDANNHAATVDGTILTTAYKDFAFDLKVNAKGFQVLNTVAAENELYYGHLTVDAEARVTGNMNQPAFNGSLSIGDGSDLTYVVPAEEKSALEQQGIVQFVTNTKSQDLFLKGISLQDTAQVLFRGMDADITLDLTDRSTLTIVIDPVTGDKLSLKGNSTLVYNSAASGSANLSGRYEITSGTYNFTFYKLTRREFDIVKGSSITWSGEPLNASLDIHASYKVETSPIELIHNQINSSNQRESNGYNQRLPFLVNMYIGGKLLVPEIKFQLDMPRDKQNAFGGVIYSKLQDINSRESDLNKQVFALLILKRFISDNPFETQAGISNAARVSVSRLLSEQLNRLSDNVKGVQLSFDLKSYEANTGTELQGQTKLQLGISKNLINDRLVVKLAGNVDIEGKYTTQKDFSEYIGDLALEYKLTADGRFRLTGFRNSNYDMIDGELTETGAGLIYIKDYTSFKELFRSDGKQK